ncbi:hypothetical protein [Streptomyces sp. NPDC005283]
MDLPIAPAIVPSTFRRVLHTAVGQYLHGPVPDLIRIYCRTRG